MRKFTILLVVVSLALLVHSFAQGVVMTSIGELVSISKTNVVLLGSDKYDTFVINSKTKLLDANGKDIPITAFKKGETVNVTTEVGSNIALKVKKGAYGPIRLF